MGAALALGERGRGRTAPNPNVGCIIVNDGHVVGRGWTQPGGRPHAEAMALAQAGSAARGGTLYVTLEPCAHASDRGPACADLIVGSGIARVVAALRDPDPRTDGTGFDRLRAAGVVVEIGVGADEAQLAMAGFLTRCRHGRPYVTLKLALSLDGCIALSDGASKWITGPAARAHGHLQRARSDVILVGRGTLNADQPTLDVRLPGLEDRGPARALLTHGAAPDRWLEVPSPEAISTLPGNDLLVEGGAGAATAFLKADLVDRLMIYRAPIVIGGRTALRELGLADLANAHHCWRPFDSRMLGNDRLDIYDRARE
ncbi:bifunctional diaminohydroxyphosphoribosylaminopyrimidine deaminase/5-amino-6-(5-phosphoribosylamino)uracil reductase RibD [Sphingomonas sp.]|uniref:bifunctional diaminohydroxyphosphoribosylaminopyrimidine deaminase/5-amino-6-(5-phosphoribosylamino)uracil reductase RibD n=1 Tax=Sphingomonas sp. TaxID=28214 RepID=UPI0025FD89C9|nr:bifunctional diaminohydroxyphosphoribosylaminopyrimidine deaminase/5-amino-6-(5-phosphoribosylamino)uracil reductase RibD [Sphingomonas sp.]